MQNTLLLLLTQRRTLAHSIDSIMIRVMQQQQQHQTLLALSIIMSIPHALLHLPTHIPHQRAKDTHFSF